jgi:hypothetical protein
MDALIATGSRIPVAAVFWFVSFALLALDALLALFVLDGARKTGFERVLVPAQTVLRREDPSGAVRDREVVVAPLRCRFCRSSSYTYRLLPAALQHILQLISDDTGESAPHASHPA